MRFKVRIVTDLMLDFDNPATEADARAVAETCLTARAGVADSGTRGRGWWKSEAVMREVTKVKEVEDA
jgi:hypothetical protein